MQPANNGTESLSKRFIRETEVAIFIGLRFPEDFPRIPSKLAGIGEFSKEYARQYWQDVLGVSPDWPL